MAARMGTKAELKLSVDDALAKISKLTKELKAIKESVNKPINLEVQVDTSKLESEMNKIKKVLGGGRDSTGRFSTIASDVRAIKDELTKLNTTLSTTVKGIGDAVTQANEFSKAMQDGKGGQQFVLLAQNVKQVNSTLKEAKEEVRDFSSEFVKNLDRSLQSASRFANGISNIFSSIRSAGTAAFGKITSLANTALETVGLSVTGMVDEAIAQEKKLQQAQIGFGNMFQNANTAAMISKVRTTAAESPGLNSGDLADYINQLGAVSGGSFDTAFNATMGILKTVQYGGGDAASQMGYIIKNIRDVVAKGKATAIDVQQFNRAMPLFQQALAAIGASEFLKDGELTITKENVDKLMEAFAGLNTEANPAYNIFSQTAKTLAGIQEEFRETTASMIATQLESMGFFDDLQKVMRNTIFTEIETDLKQVFNWIREIKANIDWEQVGKSAREAIELIKEAIGEVGKTIKSAFGNTDTVRFGMQLVSQFVKGVVDGLNEVLKFIQGVREKMGDKTLLNIAEAMGKMVTQGVLLEKVLQVGAKGLETFSNAFTSLVAAKYLMGSGSGGLTSLLGGKVAKSASTKVSGAKVVAGKVIGTAGASLAVAGVGEAAAAAVDGLSLFGDASFVVAQGLQTFSKALSGQILGSILGVPGAIAGALAGLALGLKEWQDNLNKKQAEETGAKVTEIKQEGGQQVLDAAIATLRVSGFAFDERTDAAVWTKNQVADYLNRTSAKDWSAETVYDLLTTAYRQKLGHEYMVKADNQYGFWDLQGAKVQTTATNEKGETVLTSYGERLANLIREYNMVGYNTLKELTDTTDESLIREYLANGAEELNLAQIEFLERQAQEFTDKTGSAITNTRDEIQSAIEKAGTLKNAIEIAASETEDAGMQALARTLEAYRRLQIMADETIQEINRVAKNDKFWSEETAREYLGEEGAKRYEEWKNRNNFGDFFSKDVQNLNALFGTAEVEEIVKILGQEMTQLEQNARYSTGENHTKDVAAAQAINTFLNNFSQYEDYDTLAPALIELMKKLIMDYDRSTALAVGLERLGAIDVRKLLGIGTRTSGGYGWSHGGLIPFKPIFRASGGGVGLGVDTVPAFLQPGEFVQRRSAVAKAGLSVMNALNTGDLAAAYRLIGSKISGHWDNSRNHNVNNNSDSRRWTQNNISIVNRNNSGRASSYRSLANRLALGF